mmetsp:Transcript_4558/g.10335  ORF Transcript_4558/g.10335 Transcript_4558/m.10335 type:complete len:266 (-) Transcript_4558:250-1047(-)
MDARSVVSRRSGATSVHNTTAKLNALADGFNNFYGDLEEETRIRKQAEEKRVIRIERELGKIERVIAAETKRRIEASKAIQAMFEQQLATMQIDFKEQLRATYEPLQEQIDAVVLRVERMEARMEEEKRDRELEIQRANKELLGKFAEHVKQFEVEKVARLQREAQTLKRVGDEVFRVQQKVTAERTAREASITLMKDDFFAAVKAREKADEIFKGEMFRKMAAVERDLEVETANRVSSEEQLVSALNDYTRALQDGLKIVNRAN